MAVDISNLTADELQALAVAAQERVQQLQAEKAHQAQQEEEARDARIANSVQVLTNLLGPTNAPPYDPGGTAPASIRGLLAYPPEALAAYSGIAIQMLFQGLEVLTITTRDLATVLGEK